jgi:hypothetical protein
MYGLKEKAIAKLLVKVLQISPDSDDGQILLNWKVPGKTTASRMAGDFPGRCYEVLTKRPGKYELGNMRIAEVNERLDKLSLVSKEAEQIPIFREFYLKMNPEEMTWLIRVILRQMKIGASEKTILDVSRLHRVIERDSLHIDLASRWRIAFQCIFQFTACLLGADGSQHSSSRQGYECYVDGILPTRICATPYANHFPKDDRQARMHTR